MATVTGSKGQKTRVKTMIDSGNTLDIGVAISDRFRKRMGLKYANLRRKVVGTANQKGKIIQLGETEEITIQLDGTGAKWTGKACVFQELADEMNIGTAALISAGRKQGRSLYLAFTPSGTTMGWLLPGKKTCEDRPLIKQIKEEEKMVASDEKLIKKNQAWESSIGSREERPIFAHQDTVLKKNSLNFLEIKGMTKEAFLEEPKGNLPRGYEVITAIYHKGQKKIAILNKGNCDITIKGGTQVAEAYLVNVRKSDPESPDNIKGVLEEKTEDVDRLAEVWTELRLDKNQLLQKKPQIEERNPKTN